MVSINEKTYASAYSESLTDAIFMNVILGLIDPVTYRMRLFCYSVLFIPQGYNQSLSHSHSHCHSHRHGHGHGHADAHGLNMQYQS